MEKDRAYWDSIVEDIKKKKSVVIRLTDEQSIEEALSRDGSLEGLDLKLTSARVFDDENSLSRYYILEMLDTEEGIFILVVKVVDTNIDYSIHYIDEDFDLRTREEVVDEGDTWLFNIPDDVGEEDFDPEDLEYTESFTVQTDADDESEDEEYTEMEYTMKPQGVLTGTSNIFPPESGIDSDEPTKIIEYITDEEIDNPMMLFIEISGVIEAMPGAVVNESEITVIR